MRPRVRLPDNVLRWRARAAAAVQAADASGLCNDHELARRIAVALEMGKRPRAADVARLERLGFGP